MPLKSLRLATLAIAGLCTAGGALAARPMTLDDYIVLQGPAPAEHLAYGTAPQQYVERFEPAGPGPYPVVVLIHGGCFLNQYAGMPQLRGMAAALAAQGVAAWSVEYRGLDSAGGGYPGTFLDVAAALDLVQAQAAARRLDLDRLVVVGHSAGGVLGLWAAGRARLPATSPLHAPHPLAIRKIVALGAAGDLRALDKPWQTRCDLDMRRLVGAPSAERPDPYADTSPIALTPNGSDALFINGDHDGILKPQEAADYAAQVRVRGDAAHTLVLPDASHFDEVAVTSASWRLVEAAILAAVGRGAKALRPCVPASIAGAPGAWHLLVRESDSPQRSHSHRCSSTPHGSCTNTTLAP